MLKPHQALQALTSLETFSEGKSLLHEVHPGVKIVLSLLFIILLTSVDKHDNQRLLWLSLYPASLILIAKIPLGLIFSKLMVVLPFPILAGISNLFFDRTPAGDFIGIPITYGLFSLTSILLKSISSVTTLIALMATTPLDKLANQLAKMHVPALFLSQLIFTYRYLGTLLSESSRMFLAYHLRSKTSKGIRLADSGSFLGSLLLRSFDRAERIYAAMKCRGFDARFPVIPTRPLSRDDWQYGLITGAGMVFFRLFPF